MVALSGGGDSMALLHMLLDLGRDVQAAHLDHGWREESDREARWLGEHCSAYGVTLHTTRMGAAVGSEGLEATGRRERYRWLHRLSRSLRRLVVTAHTRDDVAETVVMRMVRGTWVGGLQGPLRQRGDWLARPLLRTSRASLREYLSARGLPFLEDPSNQDERFLRVWVRNRVMPLLRERNPRVDEALARLAESARRVPQDPLVRRWAKLRKGPGRLSRLHMEQMQRLRPGQRLCLPGGVWAFLERGAVQLGRLEPSRETPKPQRFQAGVFLEFGLSLAVEEASQPEPATPFRAVLARESLPPDLEIRTRREGDRFGAQKLKKKLQDWGVEREARDRLPLLAGRHGEVVWVFGQRVHPRYLAGPASSDPLLVTATFLNK